MKRAICLIAAAFLAAALLPTAGLGEKGPLPGTLADFTEAASVVTNAEARAYEHAFFDYDGDGEEELFFIKGFSSSEGKYPMSPTIYVGSDVKSTNWAPPMQFKDVAEIDRVCFIDINPDDGGKDLVFSVVTPDGSGETMMIQGILEASGEKFGNVWRDGKSRKILPGLFRGVTADGAVVIGETRYVWDEKYWLKEDGTVQPGELEAAAVQIPLETEAPAVEPEPSVTEAPAAEPEPAVTEAPAAEPEPAVTETPAVPAPVQPAGSAAILTEVRYTCVSYTVRGNQHSASILPEYAVTFHGDGSVTFIMGGQDVPGQTWTADGNDMIISYYGQELRFIPNAEGLSVDFFGNMVMQMNP